jgi:hypothetical protein
MIISHQPKSAKKVGYISELNSGLPKASKRPPAKAGGRLVVTESNF